MLAVYFISLVHTLEYQFSYNLVYWYYFRFPQQHHAVRLDYIKCCSEGCSEAVARFSDIQPGGIPQPGDPLCPQAHTLWLAWANGQVCLCDVLC